MRRRKREEIAYDATKGRDVARLDERVDEIEDLPDGLLSRPPRALRQALKHDYTKARKGRSA